MTLQSSSAKSRQSSIDLTTMHAFSLESDSLTIHYLVDLLVLIPVIRGAWPVPLDASALGVLLSTVTVTGTSTSTGTGSITISSKVDRCIGTLAKQFLLPREHVFFIISDPAHQPDLVVAGHFLHRQRLVPQWH